MASIPRKDKKSFNVLEDSLCEKDLEKKEVASVAVQTTITVEATTNTQITISSEDAENTDPDYMFYKQAAEYLNEQTKQWIEKEEEMISKAKFGLRPKNSPSLTVLQQKKSVDSSSLDTSIIKAKALQSPIISEENKENVHTETQEIKMASISCQTDVQTLTPCSEITAEDLTAKQPSKNYWKRLMEVYAKKEEEYYQRYLAAREKEEETIVELNKTIEALQTLQEVALDIDDEQAEKEEIEEKEGHVIHV